MRFCIFCGEKIPDKAVFCPSCGAKQPEQEEITEVVETPVIEEDDSDNIALSLLSKANFASSRGNSKPIIPQYEPKKAKRVDEDGLVIEEKKEEKETKDVSVKVNTPSIKKMEENNTQAPELKIDVQYEEEMDEEDALEMARMMEMMNRGSGESSPILRDIEENIKAEKISENYDSLVGSKEKEPESQPEALENKPVKKDYRNLVYKENSYSEEPEEEEVVRSIQTNSTISTNGEEGMTADERADMKKYKEYKESGQEKKDKEKPVKEGRIRGEGRKKNGRTKEIRRNIDKEIEERDIRDIQHEEIEKKDDIDKNYDGYYENVKPIDFDKMHDNSAVIKTAVTAGVVIVLVCVVFYYIFTFFMQ